jgi:hypothetical protein
VEWFKFLKALKEELKDDWCNSVYVGQGDYETIQRNSYAIGQAKLLEALMEATVEDATEKIYESMHKS